MKGVHDHGEPFTIRESVELDRLRREGYQEPPYADRDKIKAWLEEHRKRWRAEGNMPWPD